MPTGTRARPRLLTPALLAVFAASFSGMVSFHLLLPVAPFYAASAGAGEAGAGLVSGALLFATVAAELVTPRLVARFGARLVFGVGLVLLGAPALALPASAELTAVMAVSMLRGLGFGLVVVLGSTLVAGLVPAERRGEGLGLLGIVIGVPAVLFLPAGIYLAQQLGYPPVFMAGAVAALAGLTAVAWLPGHTPPAEREVGIRHGLRMPGIWRPALVFAATAMAAGVTITFLPLALGDGAGRLVALALLLQAVAVVLARWWAGWYGDRAGPDRLVIPALTAASAGVLLLVLAGHPAAVLAAMLLFGAGFGVMQNASVTLMFRRVPRAGYPMVGAVWNLAFDVAMGLGAVGFGLLVVHTGYPWGFALLGLLMLAALAPAWRDRVHSDLTDNRCAPGP